MKKRYIFSVAVAMLLTLCTILAPAGVSASDGGATVTLSADATYFAADQPVIVHVTITNPTGHPLKVLKWHTPVDDVEGPLFSVKQNGLNVAYIGPLYKRPKPTHEDYVNLKGGESITRDIDLGLYYDLSVSGHYTISYDTTSWELYSENGNGKKEADRLTSSELKLSITGRTYSLPVTEKPSSVSGSTSYVKCTSDQQTKLTKARIQASTYSADALSYLKTGKLDSRYITWFGIYDTLRYSTVDNHFGKISSAMDTAAVTFDCGCKKKNYYAYVYPTRPYVIYLCGVFWKAPLAGTDSQGGTLIHEMSHFNTVASTDDHVYGQAGAMNLAITNPDHAIDNADNHEYFAENNPHLP